MRVGDVVVVVVVADDRELQKIVAAEDAGEDFAVMHADTDVDRYVSSFSPVL